MFEISIATMTTAAPYDPCLETPMEALKGLSDLLFVTSDLRPKFQA